MSEKNIIVVGPGGMTPAKMVAERMKSATNKMIVGSQVKSVFDQMEKLVLNENKEQLTEDQKELFDDAINLVSRVLVNTMTACKIPDYIRAEIQVGEEDYILSIAKLPPKEGIKEGSETQAPQDPKD